MEESLTPCHRNN